MTLKTGVAALVAAAEARIERLTPEQARALAEDPTVRFVDIRDVRELKREGTLPGALHARAACWNSGWIRIPLPQTRLRQRPALRAVLRPGPPLGAGHGAAPGHGLRAGVRHRGRL